MRISSAAIPGVTSLKVMRRNVVAIPAPDIMEASSKAASVERNTAESSRKHKGVYSMPWIKIIPWSE